ncbi:MAG: ABC-type sugar transport system periplasmic component-like protein [Blastococcus sp.]|jgi:ribose transport system substrate-binding protein|nr:ABC-type sugar transport system periplasmic component-like protein [Blastococcus sp.]
MRGETRKPVPGRRGTAVLAVVILVAVLAVGCRGADEKRADDGSSSGACDLHHVTEQIDDHRGIADWAYPGEPFDAKKAAGKTIFTIQENSTNPFTSTIVAGMKDVAGLIGIQLVDYPNQGQRTQWIQGIQQAISQKVGVIVLLGGTIGPIYFREQAAAANRAGIPIVTVVDRDLTQEAEQGTAARVGQPYAEAARLDADWIIKQTQCRANVLVLTSNELIAGDINSKAAQNEFDRYCGEGCTTRFVNIPLSEWATKIGTTTQTEVTSNPALNYVFPLYDAMAQFAVPAIQLGGGITRVKVATFNGTPGILRMIQTGDTVEMIVGENEAHLGYAAMDQAMRLMSGVDPLGSGDYGIPLRIFDDSNVAETGIPPEYGVGYGRQWRDGFLKAWGLSG